MRIKYEEKQAEKAFVEEQVAVQEKLMQFNAKNKGHLKETRDNYDKIKRQDNKIISANQEATRNEIHEISELDVKLKKVEADIDSENLTLDQKKEERAQLLKNLKHLTIYESFLFKVMQASEEQERDEKPKEAIKKMIDRYERLKKKQHDLRRSFFQKEEEKKNKIEEMNVKKREMQNEIFKMNSEMHKTQKDIDKLHEKLREIDLEITEKVRMNQDKMIESAKIEMAVNNLFRLIMETRKKPKNNVTNKEDTKQGVAEGIKAKLEEISSRMAELKLYHDKYKEAMKKASVHPK